MTRPRRSIVDFENTAYYHVMTRCVRRAFLCGKDKFSGIDYSTRRKWFVDRLGQLQAVFCISVAAYAVMSNHYHLVLCVDKTKAFRLTDDEVIQRWTQIFAGPKTIQLYQAGLIVSDDR